MGQGTGEGDTIAAISTSAGTGGIGIVRLSGPEALGIADRLFRPAGRGRPSSFRTFTVHYGHVVETADGKAEVVDEALLTVMRAPRSYTAEDVVEISCHGGPVVLRKILSLALAQGARPAAPGEFTKRAFLNGRMDLTQAEAVLDVIQAKTEAFLRVSAQQLKGELTVELEAIREVLMDVYTAVEAVVNFPEDDLDADGREALGRQLAGCAGRMETLLSSAGRGRVMREGVRIAICGRPNVGKSSLLNGLLRQPRAIVSETAGTTRDTIEEPAQIRGVPVQLVDTAGVLEPRDLIEEEAVRRSRMSIRAADLVLMVVDASRPLAAEDRVLAQELEGRRAIAVVNKTDLPPAFGPAQVQELLPGRPVVRVCALSGQGIDLLEEALAEQTFPVDTSESRGMVISNVRHVHALERAHRCVGEAVRILQEGLPPEFVSEEVKTAVDELDVLTGRNADQDLIDRVFSSFCIGK